MKIHALKVSGKSRQLVYESLQDGQGRFGWSYVSTADLYKLRERIETKGRGNLTEDERKCYQPFLLDIEVGDYLVYINLPTWGQCTLARVVGPYFFEWDEQVKDFSHRLGVDAESIVSFDRNDEAVEPALSARLKLQGRQWRIYTTDEFKRLLERIENGQLGKKATVDSWIRLLRSEAMPILARMTGVIQRTHPNYGLEHLLERVLLANPAFKEVRRQGGSGDRGADLRVELEQIHPLTGRVQLRRYLIQVKSFTGTHSDTTAINDIRRAFESYSDADEGLIISTASHATDDFLSKLDELKTEIGKEVHLLIGDEVAAFVLRHGWELFQEQVETVMA